MGSISLAPGLGGGALFIPPFWTITGSTALGLRSLVRGRWDGREGLAEVVAGRSRWMGIQDGRSRGRLDRQKFINVSLGDSRHLRVNLQEKVDFYMY